MARGKARADGTVVTKGPNYGTAMQAIRKHCKQCMGDDYPKRCSVNGCALWPFRAGRYPDYAREAGWAIDPPKNEKERVL